MQSSSRLPTSLAWSAQASTTLRSLRDTLARAWGDVTTPAMDADEQFIRNASDLADLELRLKQLERGSTERMPDFGRPWF